MLVSSPGYARPNVDRQADRDRRCLPRIVATGHPPARRLCTEGPRACRRNYCEARRAPGPSAPAPCRSQMDRGMRAACERGRIQAGTREHAFDPAPYAYPVGIRARNLLRDGFNLVMGAAPFARATDRKLDRRSRRLCHPTDTLAKRSRTLRHAFVADDIRPGSCAKPRSQAHPRLESETPPPPQQADGGAGFAASRIRHGQFRFSAFYSLATGPKGWA